MNVRPCGHWVYIKVDPPAEKSPSGLLYLPQGNLEERLGHATGTVLGAGPGKREKSRLIPPGVEIGQKVLFRGFLQEINKPGGVLDREYCLIHMDDVLAIVEPE